MRIGIIGSGNIGGTLTRRLSTLGHEVSVANSRGPESLADLAAETGATPATPEDAVTGAELVVIAVPSRAFGEVVAALPADGPVLSLTKGLDPLSGKRLSTLLEDRPVAALSGPNFAEEIGHGLPAAAVIASEDAELAERLQHELNSLIFRVYVHQDLVGLEIAAASKNVIALAAGGVDGLELGDNAKTAIVTRGLAEMARLGEACGGRNETFAGLAGMGDLIATSWSHLGRNRRAGELIARGSSPDEAAAEIGTVEGLTTAPVLRDLSRRVGVEMPITNSVCDILKGKSLDDLIAGLMGRRPTAE